MRQALEGGPIAPSNVFSVVTQGHTVTSGRRDRSSSLLSTLYGHSRHYRTTPGTTPGTARGQDVTTTATMPRTPPPPSTPPSNRPTDGDQTTNHYAVTLEVVPV
jgi:hypothetical protein